MKNNFAHDRIPIERPGESATSLLEDMAGSLASSLGLAITKPGAKAVGSRIGASGLSKSSDSQRVFKPVATSIGVDAPSFPGRAPGWSSAFSDPLLIAGLYMIYNQGPRHGFTADELVAAALSIANWEGMMTRSAYKDAGYLGLLPAWWTDITARRTNQTEGVPENVRRYVSQWLKANYTATSTNHRDDPLYAFVIPVLINRALNTVTKDFSYNADKGWVQLRPTPLIQRTLAELPDVFRDREKGFGTLMGLANIQGSFAKLTKWDHPDRLTKDGASYKAIITDVPFMTQLKKFVLTRMSDLSPSGDLAVSSSDDTIGLPGVAWNVAYGLRTNEPVPLPQWSRGITPYVTSPWGGRKSPKPGASTYHRAVDLRAPEGTPVFAPVNCIVTRVKKDPGSGAGLHVTIKTQGGPALYRYLHLQRAVVKVGDEVPSGGILAFSGTSGQVAPHLHFEYYPSGTKVRADPKIDPKQAWRRVL